MSSTALTASRPGGGQIQRALDWDQQRAIVKATHAPLATDPELDYFLEVCQAIGANPVMREAYLIVSEWTDGKGNKRRSVYVQVGIDFLRRKSMQSGNLVSIFGTYLAGPDGKFCVEPDGSPACLPDGTGLYAAKVGVKLASLVEPVWFIAYWDEFGSSKGVFGDKPRHMLSKVAMSHALKFGVIDVTGVYTEEEMAAMREYGGSVQVIQEEGPPRPSMPTAPKAPRLLKAEQEPEAAEAEIVEEAEEVAEAPAAQESTEEDLRKEITEDCQKLIRQAYPDEKDQYGVDWSALKADIMPLDWRGKWGGKFPQLGQWSIDQLKALRHEVEQKAQGEPAPAPAPVPEAMKPSEPEPEAEAPVVNPADFSDEDDA